jgi:hypothetical protein
MKKLIVTVLIIFYVLSGANAQFTNIGGGVALTSGFQYNGQTTTANKSGLIAISLKHTHEISGPLQFSPDFTFFYPHITINQFDKTTVSSMMFDINIHYVFNWLDRFQFYGLAGPDLLVAWKKETFERSATYKEKNDVFGLNLGIGTYVKMTKQFYIYGEVKYVLNKQYSQFMLNTGILLDIDWMKKHENTDIL